MSSTALPWVSGDDMANTLTMAQAISAIQRDLRGGLDPAQDLSRIINTLEHGQLLYMPSRFGDFVGAKVSTVAPANPERGLERINGIYVLMDSTTLQPIMLLDGQALTALRTPAVTGAVAALLAPERVDQLVVFGSGAQAWGHVEAMRAIRDVVRVCVVARDDARSTALVQRLRASGQRADVGSAREVEEAQVVVCATTARTPLFDGGTIGDDVLVVAVGSHEPDARELDAATIARSQVVVEDPGVALREAGDVIIAITEGQYDGSELVAMRDVLTGMVAVDRTRPRVFKSSGMPWEDLVIAAEIYRSR